MLKFTMLSITYFKMERQHQLLEKLNTDSKWEMVPMTHSFLLEQPSPNESPNYSWKIRSKQMSADTRYFLQETKSSTNF